jgi:hypothetical protein
MPKRPTRDMTRSAPTPIASTTQRVEEILDEAAVAAHVPNQSEQDAAQQFSRFGGFLIVALTTPRGMRQHGRPEREIVQFAKRKPAPDWVQLASENGRQWPWQRFQ